jgi:hypothetical protein
VKITYIVLTCEKYLKERGDLINKTWRRLISENDDFFFLSSIPDPGNNVLGYYDKDDQASVTSKFISLIKNNGFGDSDWIYICDDDTFVYANRLKRLLENYDSKENNCVCRLGIYNKKVIFDRWLNLSIRYPGGGAGFAISNQLYKSLKKYAARRSNFPAHPYWSDVSFGLWLKEINKKKNVKFIDRADLLKAQNPNHPENKDIDLSKVVSMHYCSKDDFNYLYGK